MDIDIQSIFAILAGLGSFALTLGAGWFFVVQPQATTYGLGRFPTLH